MRWDPGPGPGQGWIGELSSVPMSIYQQSLNKSRKLSFTLKEEMREKSKTDCVGGEER